jgi:hypothetical protein
MHNLSVVMTRKHIDSASSPTCLQLMGGGGKPGEPGRYSPDTLGLVAPEEPRARAVSPGAALPGAPAPGTPGTGATTGRGKPEVTMARSPALKVNDAIKGRHRGIAGHVTE